MFLLKVFLFSFVISFSIGRELPKYLQNLRCSYNTTAEEFDRCNTKNGNLAIPIIVKGDPEYHIPKMNPLKIPFIQLLATPTLNMNLSDIEVHGLETVRMVHLRFDLNNSSLLLKGNNITIIGHYRVDGTVMMFPIKGDGPFKITFENGTYELLNRAKVINEGGEKYLRVSQFQLKYDFGRIIFKFDNLFDGDKALGDQINTFLNENWSLVIADFGPGIADTISKLIEELYVKFSYDIPLSSLYL